MSWLLTHSPSNTKLIFDLGSRKDTNSLPPAVYERVQTTVRVAVDEDVYHSLDSAGINPKTDIDTVIFSHLHYDHVGDPSRFGPRTRFIVGPDASKTLLQGESTYPSDKESHFDSRLLPLDQVIELPDPNEDGYWKPLGPFPAAHDFFGDSSLLVVNAPGHLTGHINLLVRIAPEKWMYLAGDTAHDVRILEGACQVAVYQDPRTGNEKCAHVDKDAAEAHVRRVRALREFGDVEVVLAHDSGWLERNGGNFSVSRSKEN